MTINDIISLANAGFTRAEIAAIAAAPAPDPAPAPAPDPAPAPAPAPDPAPAPEPAAPSASADDLMRELLGLKSAIQLGNIQSMSQPEQPNAEQILASIISPVAPAEDKKG